MPHASRNGCISLITRAIACIPSLLWKRISYPLHVYTCVLQRRPILSLDYPLFSRDLIPFLEVPVSHLSLRSRPPPQGAIVFEVLIHSSKTSRGLDSLPEKPLEVLFPSSRHPFPLKILTPSSRHVLMS